MAFGNPNGPIYPLGKFTVTAAGVIVPLSNNVVVVDQSGIPATGIPPYTTSGKPSPLKCNELKIMTPTSNTGNIFLIFKSGTAAAANGTAVILVVQPGQERSIQSQLANAPFALDQLALDTDVANQVAWATVII